MTYKIRFHPKVATDLQIIAEIIAEHSGITAATHKIIHIQETVFGLADNPEKGSAQSEAGAAVRIVPAGRKGVIVFEVDKSTTTVFVLAVTYGGTVWVSKNDDLNEK